jgi:aminoglycoside phosphotransferase family enzyme/predicted kinase
VAVPRSETFPHVLAGLLTPHGYPHPVSDVELIETPLSWVLLTGHHAYKIKRPVAHAGVDLQAPERRAQQCEAELALNRPFAPDLYLAVCPISEVDGKAVVDGAGPPIEYAVRMRQFERAQELDALLRAGDIEPAELEAFGTALAEVHARLPHVQPPDGRGKPSTVCARVRSNLDQAAQALAALDKPLAIQALRAGVTAQLDRSMPMLAARWAAGRVRECHGDLHARNIVRFEDRLVPFDRLEFDPASRWIDVADELATLLADLDWRGQPRRAHAFLGGYLLASGDYQALRVLPLYRAHRALLRAKQVALHAHGASDPRVRASACVEMDALVDRAGRALRRRTPGLVVLCGLPGSGKTWLSQALGVRLGAVLLRSAVERRRLAGLCPSVRSKPAAGAALYTDVAGAAVYEHLAHCAQDVLGGGFTAIIDASFALRTDRARMAAMAARLGVPVWLIHCWAPNEVWQQRLAQRHDAGPEALQADAALFARQQQRFEPIEAEAGMDVIEANTADPACVARVMAALHPPTEPS